jgi:hypothetical protein
VPALTPSDQARVAALAAARDAWLDLADTVRESADERAIAWQERHIPPRFRDVNPWQLPRRLRRGFQRQELKYADRLARAARQYYTAAECAAEIRGIRAEAKARQPRQAALF